MKLTDILGAIFGRVCQSKPGEPKPSRPKEKFLEEVKCGLARRNFEVQRYDDSSGCGIHGKSVPFPPVKVNVYIPFTSSEVLACVFFEKDEMYNAVTAVKPEFREKTRERRYGLAENPEEIARKLASEALLLGAALCTIQRCQESETQLHG